MSEDKFIREYKENPIFRNHIDKLIVKYQQKLNDPRFLS